MREIALRLAIAENRIDARVVFSPCSGFAKCGLEYLRNRGVVPRMLSGIFLVEPIPQAVSEDFEVSLDGADIREFVA